MPVNDTDDLTLVIDQGTHASRALVFDACGTLISSAQHALALKEHAREVEHDAKSLLHSVKQSVDEVLSKHPGVRRAALVTQRSTVLAWDKHSGQALAPILSWRDTRVENDLLPLAACADDIHQRTGLRLSPHYGAGKLAWLLKHIPAVALAQREGRLALGPLASFLLHHLLEEQPLVIDHANASRTLLWNLQTADWDDRLLHYFAIPRDCLPQCRPICHHYGKLKGTNISVDAVSGDQTASLFSAGMPRARTAYANIGTGAFLLTPTASQTVLHPTLLCGLALSGKGEPLYYLEGTVNGAGAALSWAQQNQALDIDYQQLDTALNTDETPLVFLNSVGGLGSPWWKAQLTPRFIDAPADACQQNPAPCISAIIESIVFMLTHNLALISAAGIPIDQLQISGGLSRSDGLCQRLSDLTELAVNREPVFEASACGGAWLAGGFKAKTQNDRHFSPNENPRLTQRYHRFIHLIEKEIA